MPVEDALCDANDLANIDEATRSVVAASVEGAHDGPDVAGHDAQTSVCAEEHIPVR